MRPCPGSWGRVIGDWRDGVGVGGVVRRVQGRRGSGGETIKSKEERSCDCARSIYWARLSVM